MFSVLSQYSVSVSAVVVVSARAVGITVVSLWSSELGHGAPPCSPAVTHGGNLELQALNVQLAFLCHQAHYATGTDKYISEHFTPQKHGF